ncbi:peroxiredoxin family protein [Compostibacter hankyongensis]|uniref:Thioredoxin domain-containing protein n=1 Tax=Compostibacter hankyongensis TaxID=1007089 RepID=A0ABP8FIB5_9BACT
MVKRIILPAILAALLTGGLQAQAQTSSGSHPPVYLRFPEIPPFSMTQPDGSVFTNQDVQKRTPTAIILFSVDCEHCMHETEDIVKNIQKFKGTQIIMITPFRYNEMTAFYRGYGIQKYPLIHMGSDSTRRLNFFYDMRNYPGIYIYNRHNKIVFHHEGTAPVDTLLHYLHEKE